MIVHSVLFTDATLGANYERMACVLEYSIGLNSPDTPFVLHRIDEPDDELTAAVNRRPQYQRPNFLLPNARKMKHQCQIVQEATDGEVICLLDADTMVLGDLSAAGDIRGKFYNLIPEIVATERPKGSTYPLNTGVMFVLVRSYTKGLFRRWWEIVQEMVDCHALHAEWKAKAGGVNQAAFAKFDHDYPGCHIERVPCAIWNYESECQKRELFSEQTKVVHIHGNLRRHLFQHEEPCNQQVRMLAERWRELEKQAIGVAA